VSQKEQVDDEEEEEEETTTTTNLKENRSLVVQKRLEKGKERILSYPISQ
jgi:hypothetical protein